jgi:hypothetical protein
MVIVEANQTLSKSRQALNRMLHVSSIEVAVILMS